MNPPCPVCRESGRDDGVRLGQFAILICRGCGLRFAPSAFDSAVDYDGIYGSPEYVATQVEAIESHFDLASFIQNATYKAFFDHVRPFPGAKLLDVGCGVGRFCHAAHSFGWQTTGIDVSEKAISIGLPRAPCPLRRATAEQMLEEGERFDVVTAFEVLEHLSKPLDFLRQLGALATLSGSVFCTVPNWDCSPVQTATRPDWIPPVHLCFFTRRSLQRLGQLAGFAHAETGVIWTDPIPRRPKALLNWLRRRLKGQPRDPLGLWLLAHK
jgi:SAM-dependent methyltransferase